MQIHYFPPDCVPYGRIPKTHRVCRYCGKDGSQVKFRKNPHIISDFLQHNRGVSDFECDTCNAHFGAFESDFTRHLGIAHTFTSLGKTKIPKFNPPNSSLVAARFNDTGAIKITDDSAHVRFDVPNNRWSIGYKKITHTPINVYKTLLKIAIGVLPQSEVQYYSAILDFILYDKYAEKFAYFAKVLQMHTDFGTRKPFCIISERKDTSLKLPLHMVYLAFEHFSYQFFLPFCSLDVHLNYTEKIDLLFSPPIIFDTRITQGTVSTAMLDLSSRRKEKDLHGYVQFEAEPQFFRGLDHGIKPYADDGRVAIVLSPEPHPDQSQQGYKPPVNDQMSDKPQP